MTCRPSYITIQCSITVVNNRGREPGTCSWSGVSTSTVQRSLATQLSGSSIMTPETPLWMQCQQSNLSRRVHAMARRCVVQPAGAIWTCPNHFVVNRHHTSPGSLLTENGTVDTCLRECVDCDCASHWCTFGLGPCAIDWGWAHVRRVHRGAGSGHPYITRAWHGRYMRKQRHNRVRHRWLIAVQ